MPRFSWVGMVRKWLRSSTGARQRLGSWAGSRSRGFRPRLEVLEDRVTPTQLITLTVNSAAGGAGDDQHMTLTRALQITETDYLHGMDAAYLIKFNIPGPGVHTIAPPGIGTTLDRYFVVVPNVTIDGYSQGEGDAHPNTLQDGDDAKILIQIDDRLDLGGFNETVKGISVQGIDLFFSTLTVGLPHGQNTVAGNFIGVKADGKTLWGDGQEGVDIAAGQNDNTIGGFGAGDRNIISGHSFNDPHFGFQGKGVWVESGSTGNDIRNNYIGTDSTGKRAVANNVGVRLSGTGNTVSGNLIAFNQVNESASAQLQAKMGYGVLVDGSGQSSLYGNQIFSNERAGIEVQSGSSTNAHNNSIFDNGIGIELAAGTNNGLVAPVLDADVDGTVTGTAPGAGTLEFFANSAPDGAGHYEGQTFLQSIAIAQGNFSVEVPVDDNTHLTATFTDANGNTSAFSNAIATPAPTTRTWTGKGNGKWSDPKDWKENLKPESGNTFIFRAGALKTSNTNDLPGLTIGSLEIEAGYTLSGLAVTLAGDVTVKAGNTTFNLPTTLSGTGITFTIEAGAALTDPAVLGGSANLIKTGAGTLTLSAANTLTGSTILMAGTLGVGNNAALGTSDFMVQPGSGHTVTLDPMSKAIALTNDVFLQGGTLAVAAGNVSLSGLVTLDVSSTVQPATGAGLTLRGEMETSSPGTPYVLTVGGPGQTTLAGPFSAVVGNLVTVAAGGSLVLNKTLMGSAWITVDGGTLSSNDANQYGGIVILKSGTIQVGANNALGTGLLSVQTVSTAMVAAPKKTIELANKVSLQSGTLIVSGSLTLSGEVNAQAEIDPAAKSTVALTGAVKNGGQLTVGGTGSVILQGDLENSVSIVGQGRVSLGADASGDGAINVDGGTLLGLATTATTYAGTINLHAGTIQVVGTLGQGTLNVQPTAPVVHLQAATTAEVDLNNNVTLAGGVLSIEQPHRTGSVSRVVLGGKLTVTQDSEFDVHTLVELGEIGGGNELKLGGDRLPVGLAGVLDADARVTLVGACTGVLRATTSGTGAITVDGGSLASVAVTGNQFAGTINLKRGTISVGTGGFSKAPWLGTARLVVNTTGPLTMNAGSQFTTLSNPVSFEGGTLTVGGGDLLFTGLATLDAACTLTVDKGATATLNDINGTGTLTAAGEGTVFLGGFLGNVATVSVTGGVELHDTFKGGGSLSVDGGTLGSFGAAQYTGTVTLHSGQIRARDDDALGTGTLVVNPDAGKTASLVTFGTTEVTLHNSLVLQGGTLKQQGKIRIVGTVTVAAASEIDAIDTKSSLTLQSQASPFNVQAMLTLGGSGYFTLNGDLTSPAPVSVTGKARLDMSFLEGGGIVYVQGGTLTATAVPGRTFAGTIFGYSGQIQLFGNDALDSAALFVAGTPDQSLTLDTRGKSLTLSNIVQFQGGTLTVLKGQLTLNGPVNVGGTLNLAPSALVTMSGDVQNPGTLTISGFGEADLSGTLDSQSTLIVAAHAKVRRLAGFVENGTITVQGGMLF